MVLGSAIRRLVRVLARPVSGHGGLVLQPYRGYGSDREVILIGRLFRQRRAVAHHRPRRLLPGTHLHPTQRPPAHRAWHRLRRAAEGAGVTHSAVYVAPPSARRVVISRIDDTVMYADVAAKAHQRHKL